MTGSRFDEHRDPAREDEMINHDSSDEESRTATLEWPVASVEARREDYERERIDSPRSAISSRSPRTPTGTSPSSSTTATAAAPVKRAAAAIAPSRLRCEQVAVDLGQPGEVVDVLVEVGDRITPLCAARPRAARYSAVPSASAW